MIDWPNIKPLLSAQIQRASGLPANNVRWVDERGGSVQGLFPVVWLRVNAVVDDGIPYEVRTDGGPGLNQTVAQVGQRRFTLSLRFESNTPAIEDPTTAQNLADRTKLRLYMQSFVDERQGIFSVNETLSTNWLQYGPANRPTSACIVDFTCGTVSIEQDSYENGDYIDEVTVNSTPLNDVDGNPAAVQINLDIE